MMTFIKIDLLFHCFDELVFEFELRTKKINFLATETGLAEINSFVDIDLRWHGIVKIWCCLR